MAFLRVRQRLALALKIFACFILLLALAGTLYEQIGRRRDRSRYPQIGRSVDIGGRKLNIFCSGEGDPTVVFDSGGHTAGYSWITIQPAIAKLTRACWYDRAAYGWSDPGPMPRTPKAVANDLHALLQAANIAPPYVLVGASVAGFNIRVYNGLYPDEVAGAVLVSASDPDAFAHTPAYMKGPLASVPSFIRKFGCEVAAPMLLNVGLLRLMGNPGSGQPFGMENLRPDQQRELSFLSKNPGTVRGGEGCDLEEVTAEVRAAGNFGDRPLVVLASSRPFPAPPGAPYQEAADAFNGYWSHQLQPHLAALSTRGELVLTEDAQRGEPIIKAISRVVNDVRGDRSKQ
jgi:pimeloyl-ACP methyl ester carboxylesterase